MTSPTPFQHKPIPIHAVQFDGTRQGLLALLDLLPATSTVSPWTQSHTVIESQDGILQVQLNGNLLNGVLNPGDWVVFPDDGDPVFILDSSGFGLNWQPS